MKGKLVTPVAAIFLVFALPVEAAGPTPADPVVAARYSMVIDVTGGVELWSWHEAVTSGNTHVRKDVNLVAYSTDATPVMRFSLTRVAP